LDAPDTVAEVILVAMHNYPEIPQSLPLIEYIVLAAMSNYWQFLICV
jgi:hypothetical protein